MSFPRALTPKAGSLGLAVAALGAALASVGLVAVGPTGSVVNTVLPAGAVIVAGVMFFSPRYDGSLLFFLLYITLADGYLKLSTGISNVTLLRDVFLYSIAAGAALRILARRDRMVLPPWTGLVIAWVAIVLIQVFNPNGTPLHGLSATRQHLEFVPLFFFGYALLRTNGQLRTLLLVAVVVAAANGIVNLIQFTLTPEQLASWGPGYSELLLGTGGTSARVFADAATGSVFVRPFGLGGDFGFGGIVCAFAVAPALALIVLARRSKLGLAIAVPGLAIAVIGLVTSQSRTSAVGAIIVAVGFCALSLVSRRAVISLLTVAALAGGAYLLVSSFVAAHEDSGLTRYESIAPSKLVDTTLESRGGSLASIPRFVSEHPLGIGLGKLGPAAAQGRPEQETGANAENEFSFLLAELGVPGVVVLFGLMLMLARAIVRVVRSSRDPVERLLLAGLTAPMMFLAVTSFTATWSTAAYTASYFWLVAGAIAARHEGRRPSSTMYESS
jgi:hypothetical protein